MTTPQPLPDDCDAPVCASPALPETEPIAFVSGLCTADGRPISLAYAPGKPDNTACPPIAGIPALPGYLGWIDVTVDPTVVVAGPPPAGVRTCGEHFDFELAGIWCVVDPAGLPVAPFSVVWELQRDESTGAIIGGQWVIPPTGAPFAPSASAIVKRCPTIELDVVGIPESDYCVADGLIVSAWKRREYRTIDNATGLATSTVVEWSPDGVTWQTATPTGVLTPGQCVRNPEYACLKSTTAAGDPIPGTFDVKVLDLGAVGGQANAYLHWVYDSATGNGYPGNAPIPGANPSPIPMSNVAAVQAQLDAAFGAGHVVYTIDPGNPDKAFIYGLTATCAADHQSLFWWGDLASYIAKDGLDDGIQPVPSAGVTTYRTVEVIKTISGATVVVELREKDGTLIVPAPVAADWTLGVCPKCPAEGRLQAAKTTVLTGPATYAYTPSVGSVALTTFQWTIDKLPQGAQVDVTKNGDTTGYQCCGFGELDEAECGLVPSYTIQVPAGAQVRIYLKEAF
jgi:hypothetical protein